MRDVLNEMNKACQSTQTEPDHVEYGYKFWFRPYIPCSHNSALVGIVMVWPLPETEPKRHFYCVAGSEEVQEYERGSVFHIDYDKVPNLDWVANDDCVSKAVEYKRKSLNAAVDFIRNHVAAR